MHGVQILTQFPVFAFDYLVHTLSPGYLLNQFYAVVIVSDWCVVIFKVKSEQTKNTQPCSGGPRFDKKQIRVFFTVEADKLILH